jgi:hypothetical protein
MEADVFGGGLAGASGCWLVLRVNPILGDFVNSICGHSQSYCRLRLFTDDQWHPCWLKFDWMTLASNR